MNPNPITTWNNMLPEKRSEYIKTLQAMDAPFIIPNCTDKEQLERHYEAYKSIHYDRRKKIDELTRHYLGCTNEYLYHYVSDKISRYDLSPDEITTPNDIMDEATGGSNPTEIGDMLLNMDTLDINNEAIAWSEETGIVLVYFIPTLSEDDLNTLINSYNLMIRRHRIIADAKSMSLYGLTCQQVYNYLIERIHSINDIDITTPSEFDDESPTIVPSDVFAQKYVENYIYEAASIEKIEFINKLHTIYIYKHNVYWETIIKGMEDEIMSRYDTDNNIDMHINYTELPGYTPQEMIDLGVISHSSQETPGIDKFDGDTILMGDELLEWQEQWNLLYHGLPISEKYDKLNDKRVRTLAISEFFRFDPKYIVSLGWNPGYRFTPDTRVNVDKYMRKRIQSNFGESKIIDLCGLGIGQPYSKAINEDASSITLKPIFLVFEGAYSTFAIAIKAATHGIYSHASISFDPTLQKIYSYAVNGSSNGAIGGFAIESMKNKNPNFNVGVYAIFVEEDVFEKIKGNVEYFHQNMKNTSYSYSNILSILFNIPFEKSNSMICSQFVDRMLKIGGIDITHKSPSLVDPNFLHRASRADKYIYRVFEGKVKSFKPSIVLNRISRITSKAHIYTPDVIGTYDTPMPNFEFTITDMERIFDTTSDYTLPDFIYEMFHINPNTNNIDAKPTKLPEDKHSYKITN